MTVWDADNLSAPHTARELRELAQDGEPAPGSTTEPENATCPSAGGFGASAIQRFDLDIQYDLVEMEPYEQGEYILHAEASQAILTAIAAEKAEWPYAGPLHDGARKACDNIAARIKQLMGDA